MKLGPVVQEVMSFKEKSSEPLVAPLFNGAEPFVNFGRVHHEEQFCEITFLNFDQWFRGRCHLRHFLPRALVAPLLSGPKLFVQFW